MARLAVLVCVRIKVLLDFTIAGEYKAEQSVLDPQPSVQICCQSGGFIN